MAANRHGRKASVEQHRRAAACLHAARAAIYQAMFELGVLNRSYIGGPPALPDKVTAAEVRLLDRAQLAVDRARSRLEDRMFVDHNPPRGSAIELEMLGVYYPAPEDLYAALAALAALANGGPTEEHKATDQSAPT
jgi:hypothetical protein